MPLDRLRRSGIQGAALVAVTYVYFLIFAQFAFLHRLDALGLSGTSLKSVMAAMAVGGILLSLLAPRFRILPSPARRLQIGFLAAAIAAFCTAAPLNHLAALAVAFSIGAGLGLITVTLVSNLRQWIGEQLALFKVGIGTGLGYLLCNIPALFTASPQNQALTAGVLCIIGVALAGLTISSPEPTPSPQAQHAVSAIPFVLVVASFTALIWLDSAAFFIIQNTASLKANTWQGSTHLWANGAIHLSAALLSAWFLRRRGLSVVLSAAVLALAAACLLLLSPTQAIMASFFYPAGVSLYSVALVAYPSLLSPAASASQRAHQAGWIYAIAGWIGSALGIGMGQNLGHVPPPFLLIASAVVLAPLLFRIFRHRPRELAATGVVLLTGFIIYRFQPAAPVAASPSAVERGRLVYVSDGCIHCHSQYVRPNTADVLMWGPVESLTDVHNQRPPLIGNRRQGPDLSQVGARRSSLWLTMHLYDPREVSGSSIMPSYAFLFRDQRGNDLVAYLSSLGAHNATNHIVEQQSWRLPPEAFAAADSHDGPRLYQRYCATCHDANGETRLKWQSKFIESPAVLRAGALPSTGGSENVRLDHVSRIIKFGIPNSDMAGHEYLPDKDIASLSSWLVQGSAQPVQKQ